MPLFFINDLTIAGHTAKYFSFFGLHYTVGILLSLCLFLFLTWAIVSFSNRLGGFISNMVLYAILGTAGYYGWIIYKADIFLNESKARHFIINKIVTSDNINNEEIEAVFEIYPTFKATEKFSKAKYTGSSLKTYIMFQDSLYRGEFNDKAKQVLISAADNLYKIEKTKENADLAKVYLGEKGERWAKKSRF